MRGIVFLLLSALSSAVFAYPKCTSDVEECDEGMAYQACMETQPTYKGVSGYHCELDSQHGWFHGVYESGDVHNANWITTYFKKTCAMRPPRDGQTNDPAGVQSGCFDGCGYDSGREPNGIVSMRLGSGPMTYFFKGQRPTGKTCSSGQSSSQSSEKTHDQCQVTGTLTQCVSADGQHCAVTSKGNKYCWGANESGSRVSKDHTEAAIKNPVSASISAPSTPPADGGNWQVSAQEHMSVQGGGASNDYSVTTFTSTGSSGSQSHDDSHDAGTQGAGKGNGGASSDGPTSHDSGQGDGKGDHEGDSDAGSSASSIGHLYTKSNKTMESVVDAFKARVDQTELVGGIKGFMTVPNGGSCPVFVLPASPYWDALTLDFHCQPGFQALLRACGAVILAIASYCAIRIAVT